MNKWSFLDNGQPPHIVEAEGVYLHTKDGQQLLDACGGAMVTNIGHGRRQVADAVAKSTLKSGYVLPPWLTDERAALVDELREHWLPHSLRRIHTTCGGSEGLESAMKMAIHYQAGKGRTEKNNILGRTLSYHGTTLATTAIGGHAARKKGLEHVLAPRPRTETPNPLRCPDSDVTSYYVNEFQRAVDETGADNIAAYLAEPIVGASGGAIVPPMGYWEQIREICTENDILLISDEVMTGFGRTGTNFGYQHWNMTPDILVGGKGLAGGYAPLTGVYASDEVADVIQDGGYMVMFHTFAGHPAACAAAVEVLRILREENLVNRSAVMGEQLHQRLNAAFSNHPHVAEVRGKGLLQAIEIVRDRSTLETYPADQLVSQRIVSQCLKDGVCFYGGGTGEYRDVVVLGPPFIVDESHIAQMVDTLANAVDSITDTVN